ncbi:MAG: 23S rRNA (adenine(2503)-C(2))-methyltransferase RlmN, partial [Chitinophagaceae bacterium]
MAETLKIKSSKNIRQMSYADLESFFESIGEKKFRVKQVWEWLWQKHAQS